MFYSSGSSASINTTTTTTNKTELRDKLKDNQVFMICIISGISASINTTTITNKNITFFSPLTGEDSEAHH